MMRAMQRVRSSAASWWMVAIAGWSAAVPALAAPPTVYQWREADGTRAYSDAPPGPNARYSIVRLTTPSLDAAQRVRAERELAHDRELIVAAAADEATAAALYAAVDAAQAGLAQARQARELGREPQPGERLHNAGGGSRLTPDYYARQGELEDAVVRARAALDAAVAARDALGR